MDKKNLGFIALIGAVISLVVMFLISSSFGLIIYIASFIVAIVDLIKKYKSEKLTPKEFLQVAVKENTLSVITVFGIIVAIFVYEYASINELANSLF